ncbi:hypothetical protein E3E22_10510 [Thermococcus sp. MV5]|uniref:hypothetical protein n=1 Tax=Thermococcus sp. MV5 TaxID=1638272 RepID=UPI0014389E46|nr:hypothetical protein [Thermococcus sp. MV5]NJE27032.1 hypothetical protein [Thermococcus sp. MV5]
MKTMKGGLNMMKKPQLPIRKKERGNRKDMLNFRMLKAFDFFENILLDSKTRIEFSTIMKKAQREVDYYRIGLFDVDSVIYDYAERRLKALFELKTKEQVNYMNGHFTFMESQYIVTKALAEKLKVPYYWLIRNREAELWYLADITKVKVQILQLEGKKDNLARFDKDKFSMLNDEGLKEWIIKHIL